MSTSGAGLRPEVSIFAERQAFAEFVKLGCPAQGPRGHDERSKGDPQGGTQRSAVPSARAIWAASSRLVFANIEPLSGPENREFRWRESAVQSQGRKRSPVA